jgi:hypothetical protein
MATVTDDFAVLAAFDEQGHVKWVQYPNGRKFDEPVATFRETALSDVTLHAVEELSVLVYERADKVKIACIHQACNRWW